MTQIKQKIQSAVHNLAPELIEISRYLHANPETSFQEHKAVARLTAYLDKQGFAVNTGIANLPTAFQAVYGKQPSPAIAFLAEYDALPALGHACGHNLIAASSIGAAVALQQACPDLPGRILIIGTPAEEGGGGKILLARAGIFAGLDAAMMVHPDSRTELVKRTLAMTSIKVTFHGKAAHAAATPYQGVNALDAVILSFNAIGALRQQITPDARIHGIITDGGQAPNIIPERAVVVFYVRALDLAYFEELLGRVKNCLSAAALATGCTADIEVDELVYAPFKPNYSLSNIYKQNLQAFNIPITEGSETEGIASTDVGNVSRVLPTIHPSLVICEAGIPVHSPEFAQAAVSDWGQQRMLIAAQVMAMTAVDLLYNPETLIQVKSEFDNRSRTG
ncbi:MAG: M20 family metallopeptidase [Candidatus Schekmanbacteria bacterium]|nr:M20 family metallopeptidase [Candidatus Schekmanbacteria bacterium]